MCKAIAPGTAPKAEAFDHGAWSAHLDQRPGTSTDKLRKPGLVGANLQQRDILSSHRNYLGLHDGRLAYYAPERVNGIGLTRMELGEPTTVGRNDVEDLVLRAQGGDQDAFNRLITQQYGFIFRVAFRVLGHRSDAEDVTQVVCMRLATALSSFNRRASFTSWLYRITINAARDLQRSQRRRQSLADGAAAFVPDYAEAEQEAGRQLNDIWNTIRTLPEKQRDAVILVHGEGLSQEEAARIMSCQKVTVAWHLHNARKALRDLL